MKAEHRKELETNALADRMGRLLQGAREAPQRSTVWYVIFLIVAAIATFLVFRWYTTRSSDISDSWYDYYLKGPQAKDVAETYGDRPQGRSVRFDQLSQALWHAITQLGADPKGKINMLRQLSGEYEKLRDECEDDAVFAAEAMYALAVIEETLAIEEREKLDSAIERYTEVTKKHRNTVHGRLAEERLKLLNDETHLAELRGIYQQLGAELRIDRKK